MKRTIEEIKRLAEGIKVIKKLEDPITKTVIWGVQPDVDDIERQSCIWDYPRKDVQAIIKEHVGSFVAFHSYGFLGLFKPSLAEVMDCVPNELIGKFNAVSIIYAGFSDGGDMHESVVHAYNVDIVHYKGGNNGNM